MYLELKPKQILTHKLIMTPQLQQAIKLLQLSRVELVEKIQQELGENPAIEEVTESTVEVNIQDAAEWHQYLDSDNYRKKYSFGIEARESMSFENFIAAKTSLAEHLLWQLLMTSPSKKDERIGCIIVGSLDGKGYLKISIEDIAEMSTAEPHRVEQMLASMQSFVPK
jgi:RNA polymerase sigma-54 factor